MIPQLELRWQQHETALDISTNEKLVRIEAHFERKQDETRGILEHHKAESLIKIRDVEGKVDQQIQQQNQLEVELKIVEQRTLETRGRVGIVEHATAELNGRLNKESKDYLKNFEELRADEKKLTI